MKLPHWDWERVAADEPAVFALPSRAREEGPARLVYFKDAFTNQVFIGYGSPRLVHPSGLGSQARRSDARRPVPAASSFMREAGVAGLAALHAVGALRAEEQSGAPLKGGKTVRAKSPLLRLVPALPPQGPPLESSHGARY